MFKTFAEAEKYLLGLPKTGAQVFSGGTGLSRAKKLFELLGNPQDAVPAVHVAGTSGKGTVCYAVEALLRAAGKTTGLTVSPHVVDLRERMQINGQFIPQTEFCELANRVAQAGKKMDDGPTYFEATLAMAFLAFAKHKVDYAVVETGLGGTLDATNLITRHDKLAVITQIGLDHTAILGDTIEKIAEQKAGIIQPGIHALALNQETVKIFEATAKKQKAGLEIFETSKRVQHVHPREDGTEFNFKFKPWIWRHLHVGLVGNHQAVNAGLALRAVQILSERDNFELTEDTARSTLSKLRVPARFEIRKRGKHTIIIDGAHNPQKMAGVINTIKQVYPKQKVTALLAMKEDKDLRATIEILVKVADRFVVTGFFSGSSDLVSMSGSPEKLADIIRGLGKPAHVEQNPVTALDTAIQNTKGILLITGSFYFIGEIYDQLP